MSPDESFPSRGFTRFWWAQSVSAFGGYVTVLSLQALVVLTLDGSAQDVGWLNAARWLPYLVLGLVVGALVDRHRRRPVIAASDLLAGLLLAAVPVAWALDVLSLPLLLVLVACYGVAGLVGGAASTAYVASLVARGDLQRAHARLDGADAVAQSAGPAVAGGLVALVGAPLAVLLDSATYFFSAVMVLGLRGTEADRPPAAGRRLVVEVRDGVRWVYRTSGLAVLAASTHLWFVGNAVVGAVLAPYALLTLGLSPVQLGVAVALAGVGGVVGAVTTVPAGRRLGTGRAVILAHAVSAAAVVVMALAGLGGATGWTSTAVLAVGQLGYGFAIGFSSSHEESYRQLLTPPALLGRTVTTMRSVNRAVVVVVAPLGGLLADRAGTRTALAAAVVVLVGVVVLLLASPFRGARAETLPDPA